MQLGGKPTYQCRNRESLFFTSRSVKLEFIEGILHRNNEGMNKVSAEAAEYILNKGIRQL